MGFGFNFKDYNDRLTFKKPILKEVKQTLNEQDFAKAEISKEKKAKTVKEKNSVEELFVEWQPRKKGAFAHTPTKQKRQFPVSFVLVFYLP